ncbi:toll/interleukin-1 receptor domain-containing protein [Coleofasciculus sp. E1-EBD-02]|uniref:toll/interleukin-1 receptor domain-containing protein n=1 Tax=Coleofasciculus sp. E1-EBD-02 TaxID=3068481 RepID=UPI0032F9DE74
MKDFFISYSGHDKQWAEWIAWTLEEAGYTVVLQEWDFRPGGIFPLYMDRAMPGTKKTIAVLSENYLQSKYTQSEWADAFARDPEGKARTLIPIRVGKCQPQGLLRITVYVDLVNLSQQEAETALLVALQERAKPTTKPTFPGSVTTDKERLMVNPVPFPGVPITRTDKHQNQDLGFEDFQTTPTSKEIFILYSPKDRKILDQLEMSIASLEEEGSIRIWHEGKIKAGQRRSVWINERLNSATVIILLLSRRFMALDAEHQRYLEQAKQKHEAEGVYVIPILLSRVAHWKRRWFGHLQPLPRNEQPVSGGNWSNQDVAFATIAEELWEIVEELNGS